MSALAITEAIDTTWAAAPAGHAMPALKLAPEPRTPQLPGVGSSSWRLTRRGMAVAMIAFVAVFLLAVGVLVGAFLAIPEQPVRAGSSDVVAAAAQG
jgi:hypothetical protein